MERVRKTFFDPLATSKAQIREILETLPSGSAHPYSPERILLCRTDNDIDEIDISSYPEDYFFNAVDLGEMGEVLLRRMAGFQAYLKVFEDFQIMQAPAPTFKIPLVDKQITILAVSERTPTYYDFCFADESYNACCWVARNTFPGIQHSGDLLNGKDLLDYVQLDKYSLTEKEICVFISGYQTTQITRFLGTHPALLVADHVDKILYIIPVPLDAATIADATICCPLATTDRNMFCSSSQLVSTCFPEAIKCADFTITPPAPAATQVQKTSATVEATGFSQEDLQMVLDKKQAVFGTNSATLPSFLVQKDTQVIRFGTGLHFQKSADEQALTNNTSSVRLPCIFGSRLQGPVLLATASVPHNVPFSKETALLDYYKSLENAVIVVDDQMTDNARNLASSYRINALFIVQIKLEVELKKTDDILELLNSVNVNAVTALAGPQSLVVVQIFDKYYFYRGIADRAHLNTFGLAFGSDVTEILQSVGTQSIIEPKATRIVDLNAENSIILQGSGQSVYPKDLQKLFEELPVDKISSMEEDIATSVPQLQMLLNQKDLQELSKALISALSTKVSDAVAPLRATYIHFFTKEYKATDPALKRKKDDMLGELRKKTKAMQKALEPVISSFANMMSTQTTSKRTHDLKRLVRQAQIQGNVEAVKTMTFETLAGYLEMHAAEMGVMLLNIDTTPYTQLLGGLKNNAAIDASPCCHLDSRVLHLEGFDAGIIIEQSQSHHNGPLVSQAGPSHPVLSLPYLSQSHGQGSMMAWVCWDEFVNLESPYSVRWMEKCNEAHIAALRIMTRDTLANSVTSRDHDIQPGNPETGHLMSALLMAAMSKLAAMRSTIPPVSKKAEDTVTRLMRGLFGNLLTIAGSGVRPLSMVWQLFGLNPQYDLPTTDADWVWYETVVNLYPYTGWTRVQFHNNLEKLLDKAIVRVVTRAEMLNELKVNRVAEMIKYCRLRNIQLGHSRTIVTIFMRMLTSGYDNAQVSAIAGRLLEKLPRKLERQENSYGKMINYLSHLAGGGDRRAEDDLNAANVYNKRSAVFGELKTRAAEACRKSDWPEMKEACQALIDKHTEVAAHWGVNPNSLQVQNMKPYKLLLAADFGPDVDDNTKSKNLELTRQVLSDAEKWRVPWQVGKPGEFGDNVEPLDESFVQEILTGEKSEPLEIEEEKDEEGPEAGGGDLVVTTATMVEQVTIGDFSSFKSSLQASFISEMQKNLSAEDVCEIIKVPVPAMRVFVRTLHPNFIWEDMGQNFKAVIFGLVKERSNRLESRPVKKLLDLKANKKMLAIEDN